MIHTANEGFAADFWIERFWNDSDEQTDVDRSER